MGRKTKEIVIACDKSCNEFELELVEIADIVLIG